MVVAAVIADEVAIEVELRDPLREAMMAVAVVRGTVRGRTKIKLAAQTTTAREGTIRRWRMREDLVEIRGYAIAPM